MFLVAPMAAVAVGLSSKEMAVVFKSAILYGKAQRVSVE
jgi:hypothetical protein